MYRWLLSKGRIKDATNILRDFAKKNGEHVEEETFIEFEVHTVDREYCEESILSWSILIPCESVGLEMSQIFMRKLCTESCRGGVCRVQERGRSRSTGCSQAAQNTQKLYSFGSNLVSIVAEVSERFPC